MRAFGGARRLGSRRRALLVALQAFIGVGALFGGYGLLADAEGLGMEEEWLDGSPFPDYRIPGLFLLLVIGGGMLASAVLALLGSPYARLAALAMGATLALWLVVETVIVGFQAWEQYVLLVACGVVALVLLGVGAKSVSVQGMRP